jgi:hypothetical protein
MFSAELTNVARPMHRIPAPATPPTFPPSETKGRVDRPDVKVYMGTIVTNGDACVLKSGNEKYLLDSQ